MSPGNESRALRSLLFVPGDDAKKLAKGRQSEADALIVDLEDAVAPDRKEQARVMTRAFLEGPRRQAIFVRINALSTELATHDLAAVVAGRPDGIVLPKCSDPDTLGRLDDYLDALEARDGLPRGAIRILPILYEEARAVFATGGYAGVTGRLAAVMWGVEDLIADLGSVGRDTDGTLFPAVEWGRTLCLFAATAAGVPAIDAAFAAFRDHEGLERETRFVERQGFQGKIAIHPAQVEIINRVFTPSADAIAMAKRIVEAFAAQAGTGVVGLDGRMLDRPHLLAAERTLARAKAARTAAGGECAA